MNWIISVLIFIFLPSTVFGEITEASCADVRLDLNGGPMSKLPIYNQEESSLCYAYTAIQLVDAYRFSHGYRGSPGLSSVAHAASAWQGRGQIDMTLNWLDRRVEQLEALKNDKDPYRLAMGLAGCDNDCERELQLAREKRKRLREGPTSKDLPSEDTGGRMKEAIDTLKGQGFVCSENGLFRDRDFSKFDRLLALREEIEKASNPEVFLPRLRCELESCLDRSLQKKIAEILSAILSQASYKQAFIFAIMTEACTEKNDLTQIPTPQQRSYDFFSSGSASNKLMELLNRPIPQPVGIGFCSEVLQGSSVSSCYGHAAVVIGRKWMDKQCHVLVRNSYGPTCKTSGGKNLYAYPCENGQIWVPIKQLSSGIQNLTWL